MPIGAAAVAAGASLSALGVTGLLAFQGIKHEMAAQTPIGKQYSASVGRLQADLHGLEHVAAGGVLKGFQSSVAAIQPLMPRLSMDTAQLSGKLGGIVSHVMPGLVSLFVAANPLLLQFADDLDHGAAKFERWAQSSDGAKKFLTYAQAELPKVEHFVGSLATTVSHLAQGFAPLGGFVLSDLTALSKLINSLPIGVLQVLVPAVVATVVAIKGFEIANAMSVGLDKLAISETAVGRGAGAALGALGPVAAVLAAGYVATKALGDKTSFLANQFATGAVTTDKQSDALKDLTNNFQFYTHTASDSTSRIYDWATATGQARDTAITLGVKTFDVTKHLSAMGVTTQQLKAGVTGNEAAYQSLTAQIDKHGGATKDDLAQITALRAAFGNTTDASYVLSAGVATASDAFHLGAQLASTYASLLGQSTAGTTAFASAVNIVATAESNATASGSEFLSSLDTFSKTAGTAADRAALIGATLKAANGDNLSFAGSMVNVATANQAFVSGIVDAAKAVGKSGESTGTYLRSIIDLKRGTVDYTNAAAAPLITGLQGIQDAAVKAAGATYQHRVATDGSKVAADAAYSQYVSQTQGALVDEAHKLGLTTDQAKKFATQYFGLANAKDIKKQIEQEGGATVISVLNSIKSLLTTLVGVNVHPTISIHDSASRQIQTIQENLAALQSKTIDIKTYVQNVVLPEVHTQSGSHDSRIPGQHKATGGGVADGWFTVGEGSPNTWELGHKQGSKLAFFSNAQSKRLMPDGPYGRMPGYASGSGNPFTGVSYGGSKRSSTKKATSKSHAASVAASKATAAAASAARKAATLANQRANIRFTVTSDLPKFMASLFGSIGTLGSRLSKLLTDVHSAASKGIASNGLVNTIRAENAQLLYAANKRDAYAARLKAANAKLAAAQAQYNQEKTTVSQASSSFFNLGSADTSSPTAYLKDLTNRAYYTRRFAGDLQALQKKGLSKTEIQQLGEAGVDQAGTAAHLLAGFSAAQLKQVNTLNAQAVSASNSVGSLVAGSMYGAGVNAAKGLVKGIQSQYNSVAKTMTHLANVMVAQIKRALGIRSPAARLVPVGRFTALGVVKGMDDNARHVMAAAGRLSDAAVPVNQPGAGSAQGGFAGGNRPAVHVVQHITTTDPNAAADLAAARISWAVQTAS